MFSSLTMLVTYVVFGLPVGAVGIPWALLSGDINPLYRWSMWVVRTGVRLARIRVQVVGREQYSHPALYLHGQSRFESRSAYFAAAASVSDCVLY